MVTRDEIVATLNSLHDVERKKKAEEDERRDKELEFTRSIVRIMQLESVDYENILQHADHVTQQNDVAAITAAMKKLEAEYHEARKRLASVRDKKARYEQVQLEKKKRDDGLQALNERLEILQATTKALGDTQQLPLLTGTPKKTNPSTVSKQSRSGKKAGTLVPNYRQVMDQIAQLWKKRDEMPDPKLASLKVARLWKSVNEHERALEHYQIASKPLQEKKIMSLLPHEQALVREKARLRRREAYQVLFLRALNLKQRQEATDLISKYLELSTPQERPKTLAYLEELLRRQEYIQNNSLTSSDAIVSEILCSHSLGCLNDLRFQILQEMLQRSPNDPYLVESVEKLYVRRHEYDKAKELSDNFVKLPEVKKIDMYAEFAEFTPGI